jgi:hypothetical protein
MGLRAWAVASAVGLLFGVAACGGPEPGHNAASNLVKAPEAPSDQQSKCKVTKNQNEPLVVEWPDSARGRLESMSKRGLVVAHYEGCELAVLPQCRVKTGQYGWQPVTRKKSHLTIRDEDDLYANMPVGAVKLEGALKTKGELNVDMTIVGRFEVSSGDGKLSKDDLEGECDTATHLITALTVGSFVFTAGSEADVGAGAGVGAAGIKVAGGGVKSSASRETLQRDGEESACTRPAGKGAGGPPDGCGALLQIELVRLRAGGQARAPHAMAPQVAPAPPSPVAASGASGSTLGGVCAQYMEHMSCYYSRVLAASPQRDLQVAQIMSNLDASFRMYDARTRQIACRESWKAMASYFATQGC